MNGSPNSSYEGNGSTPTITKYYTGSDTIYNGDLLCFDHDSSGTAEDIARFDAARAARLGRSKLVEKPTLASLLADGFAGIVKGLGPEGLTGNGVSKQVDLIPAWAIANEIVANTDQNCAVGDLLGPVPGSYKLGRAVIPGCAYFRVTEAVDRSATSGTVHGKFGKLDVRNFLDKIRVLEDDFDSAFISATADLGRWKFTANSGTCILADDEPGGVAVLSSAAAATETSLVQNGEPWSLASGKSLFIMFRVAPSPVGAAGEDSQIGLHLYDESPMASIPADKMIIRFDGHATTPTALLEYVKDGTTGAVSESLGAIVSGTYYEFAILITNKAAGTSGQKAVQVWKDRVLVAHTTTQAEVPDDEALSIGMSALGDADTASVLKIDRIQCLNNR